MNFMKFLNSKNIKKTKKKIQTNSIRPISALTPKEIRTVSNHQILPADVLKKKKERKWKKVNFYKKQEHFYFFQSIFKFYYLKLGTFEKDIIRE